MNIGDKIKHIRVDLKKSQSQFAEEIGISRSGVVQMESGKTNPSFEIINKIRILYGINPEFFFDTHVQYSDQGKTASSEISENDLSILKEMNYLFYLDDIIPFISNSESKNRGILKDREVDLKEKIETHNKIVVISESFKLKEYIANSKDYEIIDVKKYIKNCLLEAKPSEWREGIQFDSKNVQLAVNILVIKLSVEHMTYIIDQTITKLSRDLHFILKMGIIKFDDNIARIYGVNSK